MSSYPPDPSRAPAVSIYDVEDIGMIVVVRRTQRARVEYTCCECGGPIEAGEVYEYEWQTLRGEDSHVTQRRHLTGQYCYDDSE